MASWLDAFVQGREQGLRTGLGGLEAGTAAQRGYEAEIGTRRRAEQDARLTSADMALRRNIAQSGLNYNAQVDRANIENQRQQLELDAARLQAQKEIDARNAAIQEVQLRQSQLGLADAESVRNLQSALVDPNVGAMSIIQGAGLIPYEQQQQLRSQIQEALFRKLGGDVLQRDPRGAYRFIPEAYTADNQLMIGDTPISARELQSLLRGFGIETATMYPGTEAGGRPQNTGFLSFLSPTEGGMRGF